MPELPEVETTVRGLERVMDGRIIARAEPMRADLRRPFPADLGQVLTGARVTGLSRRAKYGLVHLDRRQTMVFHLGMSGRWRIQPDEIGRHDHLLLTLDDGVRLALNDPRRFGSVDLVGSDALDGWAPFAALGPEPLAPGLDGAILGARLAGRTTAIKLLLLDQRIIAGLGNIYVCEALWRARIHPGRAGGRIGKGRLDALAQAIPQVLHESIAAGGSTLRDFARPDGELGYFASQFSVYAREGEACPRGDGGVIRRMVQGGRSTFWCPRCQR